MSPRVSLSSVLLRWLLNSQHSRFLFAKLTGAIASADITSSSYATQT